MIPRLCAEIRRLWKEERARMEESAAKVMAHLREEASAKGRCAGCR